MGSGAAVGIHDNLPPGKPGVAYGAAHHKASGGVHIKLRLRAQIALGQVGADDLFNDCVTKVMDGDVRVVLGGDHNGGAPLHLPVLVIGDGDLALSVRAQPAQRPALPLGCQRQREIVGKGDGGGHQLLCLPAGIAEHHALISCAGALELVLVAALRLEGVVHAHGDVRGLPVQRGEYGTALGVKAIGGVGVADLRHSGADDGGDVHLCLGGHFAHDHHHSGGGHRLAGHTALRVLSQHSVQYSVGNLVTDLVGMSLCDGF